MSDIKNFKMWYECKEIELFLLKNDLDFDNVDYINDKVVVTIWYGDWKHEHRYCDVLMQELNYKLDYIEMLEDSDSDNYSAMRVYEKECK